jgi:hypothetical protein
MNVTALPKRGVPSMSITNRRSLIVVVCLLVVVAVLVVAGCSAGDPTTSDEYQALEQELVAAEQQLAEAEQELVEANSGSHCGDIAFEHTLDMPSGTSVWTATGEAIDNDLFCSVATGVLDGFEDEDGAPRMPEDIEALFEAGEPFVNVSVESMSCGDAYANFELRFINEIDPSISDGEPVTKVTWAITGGIGYDTTSGEGETEIPHADGDSFFYNGTGTITKE